MAQNKALETIVNRLNSKRKIQFIASDDENNCTEKV